MRTLTPSVAARFDANEAVFLDRELQSIDPTDYLELFAGLRSRLFIPRAENVAPLALSYSYSMWTAHGKARVKGPGSKDGATIKVTRKEKIVPIKDIPVSMQWSVDDIKRAAMAGVKLEQTTIQTAMSAVGRKIDRMLAFGETGTDCTGLLNHPDVDATTVPVTKTGGGTAWTSAAKKSELLADIKAVVNAARERLQQASASFDGMPAFDQWVVGLPTKHYGLADEARSDQSDTTVIEMAKKSQFIEDIVEWNLLDHADAGTNPMIACWPRNPICLGAIIGREWEQRAPQEVGHDIIVPAVASCGGTVIRYPVAVGYLKTV
jgi:hypothetical protein